MPDTTIEKIMARFAQAPSAAQLLGSARSGNDNIVVSNMRGGSAAALAAALAEGPRGPVVIVTTTIERAEALADGMEFFGAKPLLFPPFETLPFETTEPALHVASARSRALSELAAWREGRPAPFLIAPVDALMPRVLPREAIEKLAVRIEWGQAVDIDDLARKLAAMGYRREAMVESPGEFSVRGTIVDIYPPEADTPWRLDFFGEEIESIRTFDPATQRSLPLDREIEGVQVLPSANVAPALERLQAGGKLADFFSLLPASALLIMDGPARIEQRIDYYGEVARRHWSEIESRGAGGEEPNVLRHQGFAPADWVIEAEAAKAALKRFRRIEWVELSAEGDQAVGEPIAIGAQSFDSIPANYNSFLEVVEQKRLDGFLVAIVCDNNGQAMRLDELLAERNISAVLVDENGETRAGGAGRRVQSSALDVALVIGALHEGFLFNAAKLMVVTDREIFGRYKRRRIYRKAYHGKAVKTATEIQRGDFVVHAEHGIGLFEGIRRQPVEGRISEFLELLYQDGDRLLVPIEKLNLVQKYASAEGKAPSLDKLGKKAWSRKRHKSAEAVKRLAGELLELYARREAAERPPFGPDTVWQQEFEASFVYQETPDQLRAIKEVKADLMGMRPMDRLICGDVGYGKTEVAIRAAFKALVEGKQVCVLVPTTLLAQQHYNTFNERLAGFPFKAALMCRFNSPAEQKETVAGLGTGEVRLVVGTHRILSKDIRFKDLGLLVIDEEQRFGVQQKERIKSMRAQVDVLTMTATPIPRTLHMALAKLRDLSLITTPPADRLPIKTRTIHFEKDQIEEAILRELNRGGQVFFVHNRVESIEEAARSVREIVPQARLAIAHGQMDEEELETIMMDFIAGKYDILASTTIIENGIDIPNVNTIIINRADAFGLAQLYQLRGRVGRDVRQAYAYLILPRGRAITDSAVKRLAALEEFTELGMGFSVAMRDMEIRGTGSILGGEQSGAIADVGFEMYCKLLEDAVLELRGEAPPEPLYPTEVKWPVDQWLPEEYVPIEGQRIRLYKDLASAQTLDALELVNEELLDRYGMQPREAKNLVNAFKVKLALAPWRVDTVKLAGDAARISCKEWSRPLATTLARLRSSAPWLDRIVRKPDGAVLLHPRETDEEMKPEEFLEDLGKMLEKLPAPTIESNLDATTASSV